MSGQVISKQLCFDCMFLKINEKTFIYYDKRKRNARKIHSTYWCKKRKESINVIRNECSDFISARIQKRLGKNGKS